MLFRIQLNLVFVGIYIEVRHILALVILYDLVSAVRKNVQVAISVVWRADGYFYFFCDKTRRASPQSLKSIPPKLTAVSPESFLNGANSPSIDAPNGVSAISEISTNLKFSFENTDIAQAKRDTPHYQQFFHDSHNQSDFVFNFNVYIST